VIVKEFSKYIESIEYPKSKTSWNIAGIIKGQNAFYKFDVRDMFSINGEMVQSGRTDSKADKMVLKIKDQWVILDLEELNKYIKKNKIKKVYLNELISKLEWTIFL